MIVYGDLFFLINFSMDFLCFYLSHLLLHRRMRNFRVILAAAVGGAYSVASLFIEAGQGLALIIDLIVLILMCALAYGVKNGGFLSFVKSVLLYFFVSALLGGLMTALFSLFNDLDILSFAKTNGEGLEVWIFALLAVISALITLRGGRFYRGSRARRVAKIELKSGGRAALLSALIDSGNLACEPISGKSVIFARLESCANLLDKELYSAIKSGADITALPLKIASKIRLIPSKMISGSRILPSLKFDGVTLILGKRKKELDVYVALVNEGISGGFDAIISEDATI